MIKTIFFDLGNVLININRDRVIREFAQLLKLPLQTVQEIASSPLEKEFELGLLDSNQYLQQLHQRYGILDQISLDHLIELWQKPFEENLEVSQLLPVLKKQAGLAIISNNNELHIQAVRRKFQLLDIFETLIFSFKVGVLKPDERIFRKSLQLVHAQPAECIFIDDLPENVAAAEQVGIRAHHFRISNLLRDFLLESGFSLDGSPP
jgi:epoxide hydrolase-like predicted phosphatase